MLCFWFLKDALSLASREGVLLVLSAYLPTQVFTSTGKAIYILHNKSEDVP